MDPKTLRYLILGVSERALYPLIKEYTLDHIETLTLFEVYSLMKECWASGEIGPIAAHHCGN